MNITRFYGLMPLLMNEAGDGGAGGGGTAVAVVDPGTAVVPAGETSPAVTDPAGDGGASSSGEVTPSTGRQGKSESALSYLREKPEHKGFANEAQRAITGMQRFRNMFPGQNPFAAVEALQRDLRALAGDYALEPDPRDPAGRTGIEQIRDSLAELEQADLMFYSSDPALFEAMTADEEGKAAFAKLMPHAFAKFKALSPNAYASYLASQFLESMKYDMLTDKDGKPVERADIPLRLRRMWGSIVGPDGKYLEKPDLQTLGTELVALLNFVGVVENAAKLTPETFKVENKEDGQLSERERRLAQREEQAKQQDFSTARQRVANSIATREWNKLTQGWEIDPDDRDETLALFRIRLDSIIQAGEKGLESERKRFYDANDKNGIVRHETALQEKYLPKAMKVQVEKLLNRYKKEGRKPKGATTATTTTAARTTTTQTGKTTPTAGYVSVNAKPHNNDIDWAAMQRLGNSARDMILNHRAILKDGRRVQWPAATR